MAKTTTAKSGSDEKLWAALSALIPLIAIIALLVKGNESKHIKFYSIQSIAVAIVAFVAQVVLTITFIGVILLPVVWLVSILIYIYTAIKAYGGEHYRVPMIGEYVDKSFMG